MAHPAVGVAVKGGIPDDFVTFQGQDGQDPVVIHGLGPSLDHFRISNVISQVEPFRIGEPLEELQEGRFVFGHHGPQRQM